MSRFKWREVLPEVVVFSREELLSQIYYSPSPRNARIKTREIMYRNIWLYEAHRALFDRMAKYLAEESTHRATLRALDRTYANLDELEQFTTYQPRHAIEGTEVDWRRSNYQPRHAFGLTPRP